MEPEWLGSPPCCTGDGELHLHHRVVHPDLLYVPDPCGGEGIYRMIVNRLEHARAPDEVKRGHVGQGVREHDI